MTRLPTLFISHGAPTLAIDDSAAHRFLLGLGKSLPRPKAILLASAHWESIGKPVVSLAAQPATIHDFGGFPEAMYAMRYRAPGAPGVAAQAASLLEKAAIGASASHTRGLDHGAWVPLRLMYPEADIPVAQISVLRGAAPADHVRMGAALASLRDQGVLIIGSGSLTHNLSELRGQRIDSEVPSWVSGFDAWMSDKIASNERDALLRYRSEAPFAQRNHPSEEHLMPLFVAMGAAGEGATAEKIHKSYEYGILAMDAYAFS